MCGASQLVGRIEGAAAISTDVPLNVTRASASNPGLPPSSLYSFLRVKPSIAAVYLGEFDRWGALADGAGVRGTFPALAGLAGSGRQGLVHSFGSAACECERQDARACYQGVRMQPCVPPLQRPPRRRPADTSSARRRAYINPYYQSGFDNGSFVTAQPLVSVAVLLARTLHALAAPAGAAPLLVRHLVRPAPALPRPH